MKMKINLLVVTNLPSFYKLNLYNLIAEKKKIYVVFSGTGADGRNDDFYKGNKNFKYCFLSGNVFEKTIMLCKLILSYSYDELLLGGWDSIMMMVAAMLSPKSKNSVVVESSIHESSVCGMKAFLKKIFIAKMSKIYVPGVSNGKLVQTLGFSGKLVYTKGVGVFNYIVQPKYKEILMVKKYLYVGRLVDVKNLKFLIEVFNELPHLDLTIVGFGEQEVELQKMAMKNIHFLGAVNNVELPKVYQSHDVFILPSKKEPWGLVVEEALNNGMPVIVSDMVGCYETIVNEDNGLVFKFDDKDSLMQAINRMSDVDYYNRLRKNISKYDFAKIEKEQVSCYL